MASTFLTPTRLAKEHDLASLHLRRDQALPVVLSTQVTRDADDGYAEGVVTNTRFGSFPHSTIIGVPWGSQIRASKVDTGSRGRTKRKQKQKQQQKGKDASSGGGGGGKKRKADEALLGDEDDRRKAEEDDEEEDDEEAGRDGAGAGGAAVKEAVAAESGFVHILPPTPENWTTSLPHRTQVVYTPDYSYILHRIRARPGSRLIEAGSGSGSFTHAAARAVFNGYPEKQRGAGESTEGERQNNHHFDNDAVQGELEERNGADTKDDTKGEEGAEGDGEGKSRHKYGRVFSYEFHRERHEKVKAEMVEHGLDSIVHAMHRDVYKDGFLVYDSEETPSSHETASSPAANAIFLDLPCPWEALPHLTRESPPTAQGSNSTAPGVLDPHSAVHICTFSPCIEQAQKTISALRRYDWIEIEMVEVQHRRIDVRREYTGLQYNGMRGTNAFAADVEEAVSRLRDVEQRLKDFHAGKNLVDESKKAAAKGNGIQQQQQQQQGGETAKLPFNGGRPVHRTETEMKTHTSYLVFAVLPRAWTEEDEALAQQKWAKHVRIVSHTPKSQRQLKKEAKLRAKGHTQNGVKDKTSEINEDAAKDAA